MPRSYSLSIYCPSPTLLLLIASCNCSMRTVRSSMSPSAISIETLLSPSWRGSRMNYITGFAVTVSHSKTLSTLNPDKTDAILLGTFMRYKTLSTLKPLTSPDRLSRCLTASRFSASYLVKISPSTLAFLTFSNHVSTTFGRSATYDQHLQTMSPKCSPAPLSAVAFTTPTRYSSAPLRKTKLAFIVFSQHSLAS